MAKYADASFLVSAYVPDVNSPRAQQYLSGITGPLVFTTLHALEIRNAFQLMVFRKRITAPQAQSAWKILRADFENGRFNRIEVDWRRALRLASWHTRRRTATLGTRSFDILHIATAQILRATDFLSFDSRQRNLAAALGFTIGP